jgi:hypothetical protein
VPSHRFADKPDHEREIDGAMHSSGLEFAVARPIPISGNRVMSSAWRMTPSVTDACRSERLHYRPPMRSNSPIAAT